MILEMSSKEPGGGTECCRVWYACAPGRESWALRLMTNYRDRWTPFSDCPRPDGMAVVKRDNNSALVYS